VLTGSQPALVDEATVEEDACLEVFAGLVIADAELQAYGSAS
jgi:hypothetical protein